MNKQFEFGMVVDIADQVGGGKGVVLGHNEGGSSEVYSIQLIVGGCASDKPKTFNQCWLSASDEQQTPEVGDTVKSFWVSDKLSVVQEGIFSRKTAAGTMLTSNGVGINTRRDQDSGVVLADFSIVVRKAPENPFKTASIGSLGHLAGTAHVLYKDADNSWREVDFKHKNFGDTVSDQFMIEHGGAFIHKL